MPHYYVKHKHKSDAYVVGGSNPQVSPLPELGYSDSATVVRIPHKWVRETEATKYQKKIDPDVPNCGKRRQNDTMMVYVKAKRRRAICRPGMRYYHHQNGETTQTVDVI